MMAKQYFLTWGISQGPGFLACTESELLCFTHFKSVVKKSQEDFKGKNAI